MTLAASRYTVYAKALLPAVARADTANASDRETVATAGPPTAAELIATNRLLYFARAVRTGCLDAPCRRPPALLGSAGPS
eukprot:9921747-Lingulodinium_polyedra.AAC.1